MEKTRYSDAELQEFKELILAKIAKAEKEYEELRTNVVNDEGNGVRDTSPTYKSFNEASFTLIKEQSEQLAARQVKFIKKLREALIRIENKTYGVCRVTGKLIPKERLRAVPHATLSIEAKQR